MTAGRRTAAVLLALAVGLTACSDGGGGPDDEAAATTTTPTLQIDESAVTSVALDGDFTRGLPRTARGIAADHRLQPLVVGGDPALFGAGGGLVRVSADSSSRVAATPGIEASREDNRPGQLRWVERMVSIDDGLVAMGPEVGRHGIPEIFASPVLWGSPDGATWEALGVSGLGSGSDDVYLSTLVQLPDGGLLLGGNVTEDDGETIPTLWRADNTSSTWQRLDADGLDQPDVDQLTDVAAVGDTVLVAKIVLQGDDRADLVVFRGTVDRGFEEVETAGLEGLDVEGGFDILAQLISVDDVFLIYGSLAIDEDDPTGKRDLAFFTSPDGVDWETHPLDATIVDAYFPQGVVADDDELITATATGHGVMIRRYPRE